MEVITKSKTEIVSKLIDFALFLTWNEKLGRLLIKEKGILPTSKRISDIKEWLENLICIIRAGDKILIPLGFILKRGESMHFYMASITDRISIVVWNPEEKLKLQKVSERRTKNALIQWFNDLQNKPEKVKSELEKIEEILKSKEVL